MQWRIVSSTFKGFTMEIIKHPATNHTFGAPADMQDGSCDALPVVLAESPHGAFAYSFWKPSHDELVQLALGAAIQLGVRIGGDGTSHPVVSLAVNGGML